MRIRSRFPFIALSAFLVASVAIAAPASEKEARKLAQAGQTAYDLGRFDEALDDFTKAYEASPKPGLLFNIAQCHRQMKAYERAAFFYRRYLSLAKKPSNEAQVRELLKDMEEKAAQQQATPPPESATSKPPEPAAPSGGATEAKTEDWAASPAAANAGPPPPPVDLAKAGEAGAIQVAAAQPEATAAPVAETKAKPSGLARVPWWVWVGAGVIVVGAVGGVLIFHPKPPAPTLGTIDRNGGYHP